MRLMFVLAMVLGAACGGAGGGDDSTDDPHAHVACGSDVQRNGGVGVGCEAACVHEPMYGSGSCIHAGSGAGYCSQTFVLATGEEGCCVYVQSGASSVYTFLECHP